MATELSIIEKSAVDALLAARARFANQSPFGADGLAAFARALQSMSWKIVGDIHEIANAPPSSIEAEERIRRTFVTAEDGLLARPGLERRGFSRLSHHERGRRGGRGEPVIPIGHVQT